MRKPIVLVVDDEESITRLASASLRARGYDVVVASDGASAIAAARERKPDVVVSDVMMPRMDGFELVRTLRADPSFALVPVIFLTALAGTEDRLKGFRLGADDYMPKPFHLEELAMRVANAVKHRLRLQQTLRFKSELLAKQAAAATTPPPAADSLTPPPALQGSLEQLGLSTLLSIFAVESKSGLFVARRPNAIARLLLREGRVVSATVEETGGGAARRGRAAVLELLGWSDGTFEYEATDVEVEDEVHATVTQLLVEAAKLSAAPR